MTSLFNTVNASCISDIYSIGLSGDSFTYETEDKDSNKAKFATKSAIGIKLSKIYYCPSKNIEVIPYLRMRFLELDKDGDLNRFGRVQTEYDLLSYGFDFKYLKNNKIEWLADTEIREEFIIVSDNHNNIFHEKYSNLKLLAGLRYLLKESQTTNINITALAGPLIPFKSDAKLGWNIESTLEYLRRFNQRHSLKPEMYYSYYSQEFDNFKSKRHEFGLRLNYLFRF